VGQWVVDSRNIPTQWTQEMESQVRGQPTAAPVVSPPDFSHGEILVVLAIIGVIFATIWLVVSANSPKPKPKYGPDPAQEPPHKQEPPRTEYWQAPPVQAEPTRITSLRQACEILGLPPGRITLETVRETYRKVIAQYHPDKVAHLGKELRDLAARKAVEINLAMQFVEEHSKSGTSDHPHAA